MKVAVVDPSLFTLPYDVALCGALASAGCDVVLYGRDRRPAEDFPESVRVASAFYRWTERLRPALPGPVFRAAKGIEHWMDMARLRRSFRQNRPDVVHFQWTPLPALDMHAVRRFRRDRVPVVLTVHDAKPFNGSPGSRLQRLGSGEILKEFDHLIVHSEGSRTDLIRHHGVPGDRVSMIPHGVLRGAGPAAATAQDGRRITLLLFGRIKTYKGVDLMIEALGRLPEATRCLCEVLVVGEPLIPVEPMRRRAAELGVSGSVTWDLRYVSDADMADVFRRADIFAFPYREIDTSGVLMSCLPFGKPIIATRIGAFGSLLTDGVHGRLVPREDPDALAAAIAALVADPRHREACGQAVAALGDTIPGWDDIALQTMTLYRSVLRQPADLRAN